MRFLSILGFWLSGFFACAALLHTTENNWLMVAQCVGSAVFAIYCSLLSND
jgi:hypothetical protein